MKEEIKKGYTVTDNGVNIRYHILLFVKLSGKECRVSAFEPEPNNLQLLKKIIVF